MHPRPKFAIAFAGAIGPLLYAYLMPWVSGPRRFLTASSIGSLTSREVVVAALFALVLGCFFGTYVGIVARPNRFLGWVLYAVFFVTSIVALSSLSITGLPDLSPRDIGPWLFLGGTGVGAFGGKYLAHTGPNNSLERSRDR